MSSGEFEIISRYFTHRNLHRQDVTLAVGDDCALLTVPDEQLLAISTDTLVINTHFLPDIDPADLAYKSVMVNLSDLAAMGATPAWISLAITLPEIDEKWLAAFSKSLFGVLDQQQVQLIGGDTTRGPLSLTLTVQGLIPKGAQLTRHSAQVGDKIYVTGYLGDSAAGLAILQHRLIINDEKQRNYLLQRHLRPQARISAGIALRYLANAVLDLSDGLSSDLRHILKASQCGAEIFIEDLPLSEELKYATTDKQATDWALSGGEDYELCFTVPQTQVAAVHTKLDQAGIHYTCIGQITAEAEQLCFIKNGQRVILSSSGYDHFGVNHE